MRELYERQATLKLKHIRSAIVVGLGGTGSWVALFLAMSGCENLTLMDSDYLEPTNFNRLPYSYVTCLGKPKVEAAAELIKSLRPDCNVVTEGNANEYTLSLVEGKILFDCTDIAKIQDMLYEWAAKQSKMRYVRCGYNGGSHLTITSRKAWLTGIERGHYEVVPSWVIPAAISAALAIFKAIYVPTFEFTGVIEDVSK